MFYQVDGVAGESWNEVFAALKAESETGYHRRRSICLGTQHEEASSGTNAI